MSWIKNAANTPLNANSGTLPNVSSAMLNWFQPMTFGLVTKVVEGFQVVETMQEINFMGVWQPNEGRKLSIKPEGERAWNSWMLHADPSLDLKTDDVVIYLTKQYRVMAKKDYSLYGYNYFELITDFTGSGPTPTG